MIRKWDIDNKEINQKCIDQVITRIQYIDDPNRVGVITAQEIIDIVAENLGPEIYNKALNDVIKQINEKLQDIEYSIEELKQS